MVKILLKDLRPLMVTLKLLTVPQGIKRDFKSLKSYGPVPHVVTNM